MLSTALLLAAMAASVEPELDRAIRRAAHVDVTAPKLTYQSALVDLNGDGRREALVRLTHTDFCGSGGCTLLVFMRRGATWSKVSRTTITWAPIRMLLTSSNGWRDLAVGVGGGGIIPGYEARLTFDGRRYPLNPTTPPAGRLRPGTPGDIVMTTDDKS